MPEKPQFKYFLYHSSNPVQKDDDVWEAPLPMNRTLHRNIDDISASHGDYFCAIRSFLEENDSEMITSAVSQCVGQETGPQDIREIGICLKKHGEFYHPAKIETVLDGATLSFVLNVAFSHAGKANIQREYELLKQLNAGFPCSFLPCVYGQGDVTVRDHPAIPMFLGKWLEGYHEFHISSLQGREQNIIVWDTARGNFFLTQEMVRDLYCQIAMIHTYYYDLETSEQIWPWHHAAGDFVLKLQENNEISLKLITVRQYVSLANKEGEDAESVLNALLVFLVILSIRIRLDRLDGVGDIVWADDIAVEGTLDGFFQALTSKPPVSSLPAPLEDCFRYYLSLCTEAYLADLSETIVTHTYNPLAPEVPVIRKHLGKHLETLQQAIAARVN